MEIDPKILLFDLDQTLLRSASRLKVDFIWHFIRVYKARGFSIVESFAFLKELTRALEAPTGSELSATNEIRVDGVAKQWGLFAEDFHRAIAEVFERVIHHFTPLHEAIDLLKESSSKLPGSAGHQRSLAARSVRTTFSALLSVSPRF